MCQNIGIFLGKKKLMNRVSLTLYRVSEVLRPERKHALLVNLKFSKNSGMIVYHCRTVCKNFKIFNEMRVLSNI
jgi:hypothetical protein